MLNKRIEKIPLCVDCKNLCCIKAQLNNNIEIKCNTYCKHLNKIVNTANYLRKCSGYEEGKNIVNDQKVSLEKYKKLYFSKEEGSNVEFN